MPKDTEQCKKHLEILRNLADQSTDKQCSDLLCSLVEEMMLFYERIIEDKDSQICYLTEQNSILLNIVNEECKRRNGLDNKVIDNESQALRKNNKTDKDTSFLKLVQGDDPCAILSRIHNYIDHLQGKDVSAYLLKFLDETIIWRLPTKTEFLGEFPFDESEWHNINSYLHGNPADFSNIVLDMKKLE